MTYPLTLLENIADWRDIANDPKPEKDARIVSFAEYERSIPKEMRIINTVIERRKV